jgi:hypothetical protein
VVNDRTAPAGADRLVAAAVARISAATGLQFVSDGSTTERPGNRALYQPRRYGDQWAPVLVSWTDASEVSGLDGDVVGLGGSAYVEEPARPGVPSTRVFVSGALSLDGPDLASVLSEPGGRARVEAVVLHELAHVVGLDHVNDRTQLMYPRAVPGVVGLGDGDRRGLARLGSGACHPEL